MVTPGTSFERAWPSAELPASEERTVELVAEEAEARRLDSGSEGRKLDVEDLDLQQVTWLEQS